MNCKQAKSQIALWVGNDLDETDLPELKRHVAQCACCEQYRAQMQASLDVLQETGEEPELRMQTSLWPRVASSIYARGLSPRANRFNGWVPAAAVAAACLAILLSATQRPAERRPTDTILTDVFRRVDGQSASGTSPFVIDQNGRIYRDSWQYLPQNQSTNQHNPRGLTVPTRTVPAFPYRSFDRGGF